jgi:hypothetical protein
MSKWTIIEATSSFLNCLYLFMLGSVLFEPTLLHPRPQPSATSPQRVILPLSLPSRAFYVNRPENKLLTKYGVRRTRDRSIRTRYGGGLRVAIALEWRGWLSQEDGLASCAMGRSGDAAGMGWRGWCLRYSFLICWGCVLFREGFVYVWFDVCCRGQTLGG